MAKSTHNEESGNSMDQSNSGSGENYEQSGNSSPSTMNVPDVYMDHSNSGSGENSEPSTTNFPDLDDILSEHIWSDDVDLQAATTTYLLDFLRSDECNDRMDEVLEAGVLPRMTDFLESHDHPELQTAAAGVLSIIASGVHAQKVVDQVDISSFVTVLNSANQYARNQVILALGSISKQYRDNVLAGGALLPLLALVGNISGVMQHNAMKTLSELCKGTHTEFDVITPALPILLQLIQSNDDTVVYYACRSLYRLLIGRRHHGKRARIQTMIVAGICPELVRLVRSHPSDQVIIAALRTMGHIAEIEDTQTQILMDNEGLLPRLFQLLHKNYLLRGICKEVCKLVSNFTSGNRHQIRAIISSGIMCRLVYHLKHSDNDVQIEAAWAISRTTERGSDKHIRYLGRRIWIAVYCERLSSPEGEVVIGCLNVLTHILELGKEESFLGEDWDNAYANDVRECGGYDKILTLPTHRNAEVCRMAVAIIEDYFTE